MYAEKFQSSYVAFSTCWTCNLCLQATDNEQLGCRFPRRHSPVFIECMEQMDVYVSTDIASIIIHNSVCGGMRMGAWHCNLIKAIQMAGDEIARSTAAALMNPCDGTSTVCRPNCSTHLYLLDANVIDAIWGSLKQMHSGIGDILIDLDNFGNSHAIAIGLISIVHNCKLNNRCISVRNPYKYK